MLQEEFPHFITRAQETLDLIDKWDMVVVPVIDGWLVGIEGHPSYVDTDTGEIDISFSKFVVGEDLPALVRRLVELIRQDSGTIAS